MLENKVVKLAKAINNVEHFNNFDCSFDARINKLSFIG